MKLVGKIILGGIGYSVGMIVGGMLTAAFHIHSLPPIPGDPRSPQTQFLISLLMAPILALTLTPLARGLRGRWIERCLSVAGLVFVTIGLNTIIELTIFSNLLPDKNVSFALFFVPPALFLAAVMTAGKAANQPSTLSSLTAPGWLWRLTVAWLAFPVIYFAFGMFIAPIVVPYYDAGIAGLKIPPVVVILRTQLIRSLIFLAASLPAALLWTKSRTQFILAMGLAHAMMVGVFQLVQAGFLPAILRVTHSAEITADSFVYAAVLGLLFVREKKSEAPVLAKPAAA
jgi:hypothetical protein